MQYNKDKLEVQIKRASGLCGGMEGQKMYNPMLKVCLGNDKGGFIQQRTSTKSDTRNPTYGETFKVNIRYCMKEVKSTGPNSQKSK